MDKVMSIEQAVSKITDGMTIMLGGFVGCGCADTLINYIAEKGIKDLTIITNDGGLPGKGPHILSDAGLIKKYIASHAGTNRPLSALVASRELETELIPQGTLAEKIRAAAFGLGGVVTPTGVGTLVEEGKQKITINGREFIVEEPLFADVALIRGCRVDRQGNVVTRMTTRGHSPYMAGAAKYTIVEAEHIESIGSINANDVVIPGAFVDAVVQAKFY